MNTNFKTIELLSTSTKYDNYNVDIIILTETGKYIIEVNGLYYHGLLELKCTDKYYQLMIERR
jgi:hypothetical protein